MRALSKGDEMCRVAIHFAVTLFLSLLGNTIRGPLLMMVVGERVAMAMRVEEVGRASIMVGSQWAVMWRLGRSDRKSRWCTDPSLCKESNRVSDTGTHTHSLHFSSEKEQEEVVCNGKLVHLVPRNRHVSKEKTRTGQE